MLARFSGFSISLAPELCSALAHMDDLCSTSVASSIKIAYLLIKSDLSSRVTKITKKGCLACLVVYVRFVASKLGGVSCQKRSPKNCPDAIF